MISLTKHKSKAVTVMESPALAAGTANEVRKGTIPLDGGLYSVSGLLRFETVTDLKQFVKGVYEVYQQEYDKSTEAAADIYRDTESGAVQGSPTDFWLKVGGLYVNTTHPEKGEVDIALQLMNDLKPKLTKVEEVLENFRFIEDLPVAPGSAFLLYLRNGVPERLIVSQEPTNDEKFALQEEYILA